MEWWYNNKIEDYNIALHQHSAAFNIGTLNSATLKNAISNSKTLNQPNVKQCNIEKVQHLVVKHYNGTILNSETITIAITTSATAASAK